jgi:hypothetical protein
MLYALFHFQHLIDWSLPWDQTAGFSTSIAKVLCTIFLCIFIPCPRFPTYKLRICEIWTKISRQNHFSIRKLIFPSVQSLFESVHYHQCDIFHKKLTKFDPWSPAIEPWYPGWYKNIRYNIRVIRISSVASVLSGILNDVMRIIEQVDVMSWRPRRNVMVNMACGIPELKFVFASFCGMG